jgi:hypothetical protein
MSRDDESELSKEVTNLRLQLHHAQMQVERLNGTVNYFRIEARDFEAKWLRVMEENEILRRDGVSLRREMANELEATRADLDRANEILAKLFKKDA